MYSPSVRVSILESVFSFGKVYQMRSHRGGLILALGVLGLVGLYPCALLAWLMGHADLKKMRDGIMDPEGEFLTNLGRILGMTVTMLIAIFFCGGIVLNLLVRLR